MKVVVSCQQAIGHFHAVAPLARAATDAGHEVLVATGRGLGPWVERAGFPVTELGPDWLAGGSRPEAFADPRRRMRLMSAATGALIPDFVDLLHSKRPDVVLHESLEWAAPLAADAAGVPYAALGQLPRLPQPLMAEALSGPWNAARKRLGLDPDPGLERLFPYLYLDAYLPSMQPLSDDPLLWFGGRRDDDVAHPVRPPRYQVPAPVPAWLEELPDRPTVYVTMGTAFNQVAHVFATVVEALAAEDVNVVMTLGPGMDATALSARATNVWAAEYIPQDAVLARADVVVHHSGYLTIVGALAEGLPQVLIPVAVDQPYHAHRLAAAGVAERLDHRTLDAGEVRRAVRATLDDPLYRGNAERLRAEMLALPPVEHGIALLERLAETGAPVVRGKDTVEHAEQRA